MANVSGLVRATNIVKVGDELNGPYLTVNPDGSINVNVSSSGSAGVVQSVYNEISSVAMNATAVLNTYTVPIDKTAAIQKIEFGGENIATYEVYVNSAKIDKKRTYFGSNLSSEIDFASSSTSLLLNAGDVLQIKVTNFRPTSADFESRIQVIEI